MNYKTLVVLLIKPERKATEGSEIPQEFCNRHCFLSTLLGGNGSEIDHYTFLCISGYAFNVEHLKDTNSGKLISLLLLIFLIFGCRPVEHTSFGGPADRKILGFV